MITLRIFSLFSIFCLVNILSAGLASASTFSSPSYSVDNGQFMTGLGGGNANQASANYQVINDAQSVAGQSSIGSANYNVNPGSGPVDPVSVMGVSAVSGGGSIYPQPTIIKVFGNNAINPTSIHFDTNIETQYQFVLTGPVTKALTGTIYSIGHDVDISGLPDGKYSVELLARNNAGVWSKAHYYSFDINTTSPVEDKTASSPNSQTENAKPEQSSTTQSTPGDSKTYSPRSSPPVIKPSQGTVPVVGTPEEPIPLPTPEKPGTYSVDEKALPPATQNQGGKAVGDSSSTNVVPGTENKQNGWIKWIGVILGLLLVSFILFLIMKKLWVFLAATKGGQGHLLNANGEGVAGLRLELWEESDNGKLLGSYTSVSDGKFHLKAGSLTKYKVRVVNPSNGQLLKQVTVTSNKVGEVDQDIQL